MVVTKIKMISRFIRFCFIIYYENLPNDAVNRPNSANILFFIAHDDIFTIVKVR